jgi:hypothetical protein
MAVLESDGVEAEPPTAPVAATVADGRACPQCGTEISATIRACPQCGSGVAEAEYAAFMTPVAEAQEEIKEDDQEPEPSPGDTLAARALRAAIVGVLILPPFITFYSIWLLLRLASYEGEVGNAAIRKGIGAFIINTAVLVAVIEFLRLFVW